MTFVVGYAVLLLCVPSQLVVGPLGGVGTPANLWGIAALLWWLCATVGGQNPGRRGLPVRVALGALAVVVLAAYANGMASGWYAPSDVRQETDEFWALVPFTVSELNEKMISAANRGLISFASWTGIALLTADGLRSWKDLEQLASWVSWLGGFIASLGIVQFFTGLDIAGFFQIPGLVANSEFGGVVARSVLNRVSATAVHPIEFGVVLAAIFPLALHRTIHEPRSKWAWPPTLLIGIAIPMSVSRSAVLVLGMSLAIMFVGWPARWRLRALAIAPLAVVAMRAAIPGLVGTIVSLFRNVSDDPSTTGRLDDYGVALDLYQDHPWLGRGLFTLVPRYYRILDNQMLVWLLELGAVGVVTVLVFFAVAFFCARGARRRSTSPRSRHLALALSGSIAGMVISFATFDALGFPMAAGLSFLLVGMAGAAWQIANKEDAEAAPSGPRRWEVEIAGV